MSVVIVKCAEDIPKQAISSKPTIVYWNILGLVQPVRLALAYGNADFVDVRIDAGDPQALDSYKQTWFKTKSELANILAFPNLPYYLDDQVSLTQSDTILRYLGRKYNLMGDVEQENVLNLAMDELKDLENVLDRICYSQGLESLAEWYKEKVPVKLAQFERFLCDNTFLTGSELCIADLKLFAFLCKLKIIQVHVQDNDIPAPHASPVWKKYYKRVEEIPSIQRYLTGPSFMRGPMNNPHAKFNNSKVSADS